MAMWTQGPILHLPRFCKRECLGQSVTNPLRSSYSECCKTSLRLGITRKAVTDRPPLLHHGDAISRSGGGLERCSSGHDHHRGRLGRNRRWPVVELADGFGSDEGGQVSGFGLLAARRRRGAHREHAHWGCGAVADSSGEGSSPIAGCTFRFGRPSSCRSYSHATWRRQADHGRQHCGTVWHSVAGRQPSH